MNSSNDTTVPNGYKRCAKGADCLHPMGSLQPASDIFFNRAKTLKCGLNAQCKHCTRAEKRLHYLRNPAPYIQRANDWHKANPQKSRQIKNKWSANNRDSERNKERRWSLAHPERRREIARNYRLRNPEKAKEISRMSRLKHPDKCRANERRRRAMKQNAEGTFNESDVQQMLRQQRKKCYYCGGKLTKYHIEHVIPLSRGGSNEPSNLVLACPSCNLHKNNKMPHEWSAGGRLL